MAQPQEPRTGEKRGPGRPRSTATPAMKKQRLSAVTTPLQNIPILHSPAAASLAPALEKKVVRLPAKVAENKPLPTLSEPQSDALSNSEYQSIAASAVLTTSLDRSRLNWISNGIFKRHWVKPESGKNAKPPPPGNPDAKLMKSRGPCRMRIEPHIFEAEVYVEERPKPPPAPKQYAAPTHTPFGAPYRSTQPGQPPQDPQIQNRTQSPAVVTPAHPPLQPPLRGSQPSTPTPAAPAEKKADPVISMLASRASSDPELKSLMKEVATGNATPDQLKIFQRHIDELTAIIQTQKKADGPNTPSADSGSNAIQYDGAAGSRSTPQQPVPQPTQQRPSYPAAQVPAYHQQPAWTPVPIPTNLPVVFSFSTPGASEDRFLFPEHCILEALSPQHLLVSFMVVRKGRDAIDTSGLDPDKEYWQPITMMVEVAYGREEILNCIRRWVKPAEDSRKHMEEVMQRCERAPETHLALRLPLKSTLLPESEEASKEATPVVDEKTKSKPTVKAAKKATSKTAAPSEKPANTAATVPTSASTGESIREPVPDATASASDQKDAPPTSTDSSEANKDTSAAEDDGRPRRATRKSVRISEV